MVAIQMLGGLSVAYAVADDLGPLPIELLADAVASGRTDGARGYAMNLLIRWSADDPAARDAVLHWGRAEIGPPAWPDLPAVLFQWVRNSPHDYQEALGAALAAEPALLRNPRVRWMAECEERARVFQGRFTSPEERQDPCHPANMPPARHDE
ncbi:MAG: hypothetical protein EA422_00550 [Gemmatimonadales bacterium]|nr:MAG: hypothetical protein EA422_00550 [Gemmatimonadales bacterium]